MWSLFPFQPSEYASHMVIINSTQLLIVGSIDGVSDGGVLVDGDAEGKGDTLGSVVMVGIGVGGTEKVEAIEGRELGKGVGPCEGELVG